MYEDKALARILREMPARHNFYYVDETERAVLRALFNSMSSNGKYLSFFFPHGPPGPSDTLRMRASDSTTAYHPKRPCMHQFEKGEPIYRCNDCGLDDTCVLCWRCFDASDHTGHSVSVSIAQKNDGGVCDCGDPEAWTKPTTCKYFTETDENSSKPLPDDLVDCIRGTITRVVDYIIDVISCTPQDYQYSKDPNLVIQDRDSFKLDPSLYGGEGDDKCDDNFALLLWNDEKHSFNEITALVCRATHRRESYGNSISMAVDEVGRKIVSRSDDLPSLINAWSIIDHAQVTVSIRSMRDTFREDMCGTMLKFLNDLAGSSLDGHPFILRDIICEVLCQPWRVGSAATKVEKAFGNSQEVDASLSMITRPCFDMTEPDKSCASLTVVEQSEGLDYWNVNLLTAEESASLQRARENALIPTEFVSFNATKKIRLDWLIHLESRFWKTARLRLKDLFMATVISNLQYKMTMGIHFAGIYPELIEYYALSDREPEYSILALATQLFTCPAIANEIVQSQLSSFFAATYTFLTTGHINSPKSVDLTASITTDKSVLDNRRIGHLYIDIEHLLSRKQIPCSGNSIRQFADILLLMQGCAPFVRQINEHVEYESTEWLLYLHAISPMAKLSRMIALDITQLHDFTPVRFVAESLTAWTLGHMRDRFPNNQFLENVTVQCLSCGDFSTEVFPIVRFPVEFYVHSLYNPLLALLTWMAEFGGFESPEQLCNTISFPSLTRGGRPEIGNASDRLIFMLDYPLRSLVVVAQIRANLWVRNGYSLRSFEMHYRDWTLRETCYSRDIFGVQMMISLCNPSRAMLTIIDRWSLIGWLGGSVVHGTFDESKLLTIVEEFLHGMIVLLSERVHLQGFSEDELNNFLIRREIIQDLCCESMAFSELSKRLLGSVSADDKFEQILFELTNYKAPEGLSDHGVYELKPELHEEIDPYCFQYTATQWDAAESFIKNAIHMKTKQPIKEIVIVPHLQPITKGPFTRLGWIVGTPEFAQMIYVTLINVVFQRVSPSSNSLESLLNLTLYLCHLAVIEDQICVKDPERTLPTFSTNAVTLMATKVAPTDGQYQTIFDILLYIKNSNQFESNCHVAANIIKIIKSNQDTVSQISGTLVYEDNEKSETENTTSKGEAESETERKKRLAKERQEKILSDFKLQQQSFADQNMDLDDSEQDVMSELSEDEGDNWKYPSGLCILCRKPSVGVDIAGTVGYYTDTNIIRQAPYESNEYMLDALNANEAELDRPSMGQVKHALSDTTFVGHGFPRSHVKKEVIMSSCGHILHFSCFEWFRDAIKTRHRQYITRNLPEIIERDEFLCPLCKSLNNVFIPLLFKPTATTFDSVLSPENPFLEWMVDEAWKGISQLRGVFSPIDGEDIPISKFAFQNVRKVAEDTLKGQFNRGFFINTDITNDCSDIVPYEVDAQIEMDAVLNAYEQICTVLGRLEGELADNTLSGNRYPIGPFQRLLIAYGYTISAAEIASRGANGADGNSLDLSACILDQVHSRTMTLLRILRASAICQFAISCRGITQDIRQTQTRRQYANSLHQQVGKLFFGQECMYDKNSVTSPHIVYPLLLEDVFVFLAQCSLCMVPCTGFDLHHIVALCYTAQIVKVLYHLGERIYKKDAWLGLPEIQALGNSVKLEEDTVYAIKSFMADVLRACGCINEASADLTSIVSPATLYVLVNRFTLPFLRKAAILFYVEGPMEYNGDALFEVDGDETDRLLTLLKLPTLDVMFNSLGTERGRKGIEDSNLLKVINRWCTHVDMARRRPQSLQYMRIGLEYPGIERLLRLPSSLYQFFQKLSALKCGNCNKIPEDPAICLFCGTLVCCQNYCCLKDNIGECNRHMEECAGSIGFFLLIKKCSVLFLRQGQGLFFPAPYLDVHGEVDQNLKRGRPLYLSDKRYNESVRNVWLRSEAYSKIARRIEANMDSGGWESL
ncbi:uncharacterized protein V1516DRAFT_620803 [Lipomyces oligophaga]|uniref:uncharacterized protein n=1 Tax=Lipomyces oligophaga TaxID=45792 RepID=UPI0034CD71BA